MFTASKDKFIEVVDITLYKYNSVDLKLWGIAQRDSESKKIGDDSVIISANKLRWILQSYFRHDLNRIEAISDVNVHKEATSIYFLDKVFKSMDKLAWIKLTLNKNASYNRIVMVDEMKTIKFSIKVLRGTMRLFEHFSRQELGYVNKLFSRAGLMGTDENFKVFKVSELLNVLDMYTSENNTTEVFNITSIIIQHLENYEQDNPEVLIITDRELDI